MQGYVFNGWYTSSSFASRYVFNKITAQNLTLFAKWDKNGSGFNAPIEISSYLTSDEFDVSITTPNQKIYFKFTPANYGQYVIQSCGGSNVDPIGSLYSSNQTLLETNDYNFTAYCKTGDNFAIVRTLYANTTYYIVVGLNGTGTGYYELWVSRKY
jgi:uncharacterized repeat protein (TIGR02543 family)